MRSVEHQLCYSNINNNDNRDTEGIVSSNDKVYLQNYNGLCVVGMNLSTSNNIARSSPTCPQQPNQF
jgi:hypothetical protein